MVPLLLSPARQRSGHGLCFLIEAKEWSAVKHLFLHGVVVLWAPEYRPNALPTEAYRCIIYPGLLYDVFLIPEHIFPDRGQILSRSLLPTYLYSVTTNVYK